MKLGANRAHPYYRAVLGTVNGEYPITTFSRQL